jgi:hypothetical protein
MDLIILYETINAKLYFDDSILYLKILTQNYIIQEIRLFINYILNFFEYCDKLNLKISIFYDFNCINLSNVPIIEIFNKTKHLFLNLKPNDTNCVNSFCVLLNNKIFKNTLKILLKIINPTKPYIITKSQEKINKFLI